MFQEEFKKALHLIANGVFVVSAEDEGEIRGFTATWVSQVSFEHRYLMVSASKHHNTYPLIANSRRYVVNILGVSNVDIARHFGRPRRPGDPLEMEYFRKENGVATPVLAETMAFLKCKVISSLDVKDHTIFVGEIEDAQVLRQENPLLYYPRKSYVTKYE
ncbi:MAG: flavin reductase family protein [Chloroflexi bacterium]|nr:flavin reductase family protein [Chloroflexota bacterium]